VLGDDENIGAQTWVGIIANVAVVTLKSCHCTVTVNTMLCETEPEVAVTAIDAVSPVDCCIGLPEPQPAMPASPIATQASAGNPKMIFVD
jgi:hypothetical protein